MIGCMIVSGRTNMNTFTLFLELLKKEIEHEDFRCYEKIIILLDGAKIHLGDIPKRFMLMNPKWKFLVAPAYCSALQPVEYFWNILKNMIRQTVLENDNLQYKAIQCMEMLEPYDYLKCFLHTLRFWKDCILFNN